MKLIDILVQELPELGGWPPSTESLYQNAKGRLVDTQGCILNTVDMKLSVIADDTHRSVTREQYEAALAASKPEWDGDGLPPVGAEVECICNELPNEYKERLLGHILYSGEYTILKTYKTNNQHHVPVESVFKTKSWAITPIRSEAEKKKEEAIKAIDDAQSQVFDQDSTFSEYLYDAIASGKIPHIRID